MDGPGPPKIGKAFRTLPFTNNDFHKLGQDDSYTFAKNCVMKYRRWVLSILFTNIEQLQSSKLKFGIFLTTVEQDFWKLLVVWCAAGNFRRFDVRKENEDAIPMDLTRSVNFLKIVAFPNLKQNLGINHRCYSCSRI
jgi:hypothetical protein